jgi:hypothetical protein
MPSELSLYRKIQVVLDVAKSIEPNSIDELREEIKSQGYTNFLARKYDSEKDDFIQFISVRSIRRTMAFCLTLGLLETDGSLSKQGRKAIDRTKYDKTVAGQIRPLLEGSDIHLPEFNKIILKKLRSSPPVLPTCKELWAEVETKMSYSQFSRLMTMLVHCGGACSSQAKIYLHIEPK